MSGPIYRLDRRDSAEPEVVAVFLKAGATVVRHSGRDEPDLFVGYRGVWHAVEVKTDRAGLRPGQHAWAEACSGEPPSVARTAPQARKLLRMWHEAGRPSNVTTGQRRALAAPLRGGSWSAAEEAEREAVSPCGGKDPEAPA